MKATRYSHYHSGNLPRLRASGRNRTVPLTSLTPNLWMMLDQGQSVVIRSSGIVLRKTSARTVRASLLPGCEWREIYAAGYATGWYESVSKNGVISRKAQMYTDSGSKQGGLRRVEVEVTGRETNIIVFLPWCDHLSVYYPLEQFSVEPGRLTHQNGWYITL